MEHIKKDIVSKCVRNMISVLFCLIAAYGIAYGVTTYVAYETQVDGDSMEPALQDGDAIIVEKLSYYFHNPRRYDVVVFPVEDVEKRGKISQYYVKRVIGLPGETIQIKNGRVYIDGKVLESDNFGNTSIESPGEVARPVRLGEGEYFVLGDNRNVSSDSRSKYIGMIQRRQIEGQVLGCVWPWRHFGKVPKKQME